MSCMILLAAQATVSTTQLVRKQALRMSWVVVTDEHGNRQLRRQWKIAGRLLRTP